MEPTTREVAEELLKIPLSGSTMQSEEDVHPWSCQSAPFKKCGKPMMRIFDENSGSLPTSAGFLLARAASQRLDTKETRIEALTGHIDYKRWEATPFISFTDDPERLAWLANSQTRTRGPQTLVVIDPKVRLDLGLPMLSMAAELEYYDVEVPYKWDYSKNEHICLWQVQPEELVGIWKWDDLFKHSGWYDKIIVPAWKQHWQNYTAKRDMVRTQTHSTENELDKKLQNLTLSEVHTDHEQTSDIQAVSIDVNTSDTKSEQTSSSKQAEPDISDELAGLPAVHNSQSGLHNRVHLLLQSEVLQDLERYRQVLDAAVEALETGIRLEQDQHARKIAKLQEKIAKISKDLQVIDAAIERES